jgi:hypothetical protein
MLTLNEKDLKDLNAFIQDLPLKHGLPLLNFINSRLQEQQAEVKPEENKPE